MREITLDVFIDMIYLEIQRNITEEICRTCPVVEYISELRHTIKDMTHEQLSTELGIAFSNKKCPCEKKRS